MKAMIYDRYGPAENVHAANLPRPAPGPRDVVIRVCATSVTSADWRLRAAAFPGALMATFGRLMFGVLRPRKKVLGGEFSGLVVETGAEVEEFSIGDAVFGASMLGAHAEYLKLSADACIAPKPARLSHAQAAALPFGGLSSLVFLRDFARLQPGQKVLILGASGGVGTYAVQIAKALGADVTAVAGTARQDILRDLGADRVLDYTRQRLSEAGSDFDLVLDPAGMSDFRTVKALLKRDGVYIPLTFTFREVRQSILAKLTGGPQVVIGVNSDKKSDLQELAKMVDAGVLRPVIDQRFKLDDIIAAYRLVESRHRKGSVVIDVDTSLSKVA